MRTTALVIACAVCALTACGREPRTQAAADTPTLRAPSTSDADARRFRYTRAVTLEERDGYSLLTINPGGLNRWQYRYALVPRNSVVSVAEDDARVIGVPVQRVTVETPTGVLQYIEELGASDAVVSVSSKAAVYPWLPRLHQRLQAGDIQDSGSHGDGTNVERLLVLKPELVLIDFVGPTGAHLALEHRTNLTGIAIAVRLERHPLASAEWIKVMGLLFDREAEAAAQFAGIESRYRDLAGRVATAGRRPRVLPMRMEDDRWQDRDVIRQIVVDAGGQPVPAAPDVWTYYYDYPYEVILDQGLDADIWPFARPWWKSISAITAEDSRLAAFRPVREGRVYHPNGRMLPRLVDPYFTALYLYPDRVLADLVYLFHPDVLPDHQLYYFRRIEDTAK